MTIRRRLLLLLLPALALLMLLGGLADYWITVATTRNAYDQALGSTALAAAASLHSEDGKLSISAAQRAVVARRPDADSSTFWSITGPDGELIAGSAQLPMAKAVNGTRSDGVAYRDALFQGEKLRIASVRSHTDAGPITVTVAETLQRRAGTQRVMLLGKLLVDFAELDVTLLLIWIAVYLGLRPLARVRARVEQQSSGSLQRFDEADVPGELRPLILALNQLLELRHAAAQSQRRFVADAAHQMRTPVAGLLAQLELVLRAPEAAAVQAQLANINRGVQQLAHTANQLLALARAEPAAAVGESFKAVSLRTLVEQQVERNVDRAMNSGLDLGADAQPAQVSGNAWLLEDLLGNLLDNALKYTPRGGRVTVRSGLDQQHPFLEVEDDGPGIAEAERARVRERFYRLPGAPGSGCGLGLAIVEEIAHAHRATLIIGTASQGRGARMRVRFAATA
ncbi:MAG TPA: sensor histidine kinase N-terminal domain-containing protein [Steroidobacteraceae bacterium]|jgi:two-component system sensor histidine kinase TctE